MDGDTPIEGNEGTPVPEPGAGAEPVGPGMTTPEPPARRKRRLLILAGVLAGLLLIAGGAVAAVMFVLRGTGDVLVGQVPKDAMVYATAYLDPSASQKLNLNNLLEKFPAWNEKDFRNSVDDTLSQMFSGSSLEYQRDVKPWIGTQVGLVVLTPASPGKDPGGALLLATTDEGASEDALTKTQEADGTLDWKTADYGGTTIHVGSSGITGFAGDTAPSAAWAVTDGTVVISDGEDSVKAIIDAKDGSLADSDGYDATVSALPKDRLATIFFNVPVLADILRTEPGMGDALALGGSNPFTQLKAIHGIGMSVAAESDGIAMRMAVNMDPDAFPPQSQVEPHANSVLDWTPADAYGLLASSGLDQSIDQAISQFEQLTPGVRQGVDSLGLTDAVKGLAGDFGLVVNPASGSPVPGGAMLMEVDDPAAVRTFLDRLATLVAGGLAASASDSGGSVGGLGVSPLSLAKLPMPGWKTETYEGTEIKYLEAPELAASGFEPAYAVTDDMAIIATGPDEVKTLIDTSKGESVTSSENYKAAIVHGDEESAGIFYLDLESIIGAVAGAEPYGGQEIQTQLAPLKAFIVTSSQDGDTAVADMFLLIN